MPDSVISSEISSSSDNPKAEQELNAGIADRAWAFCADCHAMPLPSSFSRDRWAHEVQRGFDFYFASGRADLDVPKSAEIKRYFEERAPHSLVLPAPLLVDQLAEARFQHIQMAAIPNLADSIAGASIQVIDWGGGLGKRLMQADMRGGGIIASTFGPDQLSNFGFGESQVVASLRNPCRFVHCDLDASGVPGLLVADLGSFLPADHARGRVVWLRRNSSDELIFEQEVLLENCGRISDVKLADLDNDGDLDIAVAEFGWHETGRLLWLENTSVSITAGTNAVKSGAAQYVSSATFKTHILDERSGAMEVELIDVDGDDRLDVVALFAQEYEEIVGFIGDGKGGFSRQKLYSADDPAYGSSGFEFVDFDNDGDLDMLYTNGDSFDSFQAKPYHAVHLLENHGQFNFEDRQLATLPGAHRATAVDIDQDGDLDIIACSFLPENMLNSFPGHPPMALIWVENRGNSQFQVRPLKTGNCSHPALCIDDLNEDGKPDIAVTNFYMDSAATSPSIDVWLSR